MSLMTLFLEYFCGEEKETTLNAQADTHMDLFSKGHESHNLLILLAPNPRLGLFADLFFHF